MSKYSNEKLRAMAKSALYHKVYDSRAYNLLLQQVSSFSGLSIPQVELKILQLSSMDIGSGSGE